MSAGPDTRIPLSVAIVGSGAGGCYAAQFLRKTWSDAHIIVFESAPVPYGLIRSGIAPDHQGNKAVTRQFDRLFERSGVVFLGGVEIGRDISYDALADAFDIVVLATGMEADRALPVHVDTGARVVGAGTLMRLLNADSAVRRVPDAIGPDVVVIGNGNVAMDVVRMLVAAIDHFAGSDVDDDALQTLRREGVRRVEVVGRSSAETAKFDLAVLKQLVRMRGVRVTAVGLDDAHGAVAQELRRAQERSDDGEPASVEVCFRFHTRPSRLGVRGERTVVHADAEHGPVELVAHTVVTAVGFVEAERSRSVESVPQSHVVKVGWARNGATGGLAANRSCAREVVADLARAVARGEIAGGKPGLAGVAPSLPDRVVGFDDWRRIDAYERATAGPQRCRTKVAAREDLFALANGQADALPSRPDRRGEAVLGGVR